MADHRFVALFGSAMAYAPSLLACSCSSTKRVSLDESAAPQASGPSGEAPEQDSVEEGTPPLPATFPANWCARAGANEAEQVNFFFDIAIGYSDDQSKNCTTSGLTSSFSDDQPTEWLNYLIGYTNSMVGCPLLYDPVEGGILAFGPANTMALGVERPALSRDDAAALIELYLLHFARTLALSEEERSAVEAHLWLTAEPEVDPAASRTLSECPEADAGP